MINPVHPEEIEIIRDLNDTWTLVVNQALSLRWTAEEVPVGRAVCIPGNPRPFIKELFRTAGWTVTEAHHGMLVFFPPNAP